MDDLIMSLDGAILRTVQRVDGKGNEKLCVVATIHRTDLGDVANVWLMEDEKPGVRKITVEEISYGSSMTAKDLAKTVAAAMAARYARENNHISFALSLIRYQLVGPN